MKDDKERKRVGIWVRVSTEDQVRGESPEHHERRAQYYAEAKEWTVAEVYRLDAVSGKTVKEHPEAKRMLEDVKAGHITGLIFSKLARLARNTKELLDFSEYFREHGADLISLAESIDTSTPAGRLFYTMIAAMAQWEREEIGERVAASIPIRAKMGKPISGLGPFGYHWKDKKLIPDPVFAPIRVLIHELFREHKRKKVVARILNERGFRTRSGSRFTDSTMERVLRDPTAKGVRRANYTRSGGRNKPVIFKPESEWICTGVEPIISEELWNECIAILDGMKAKGRKPAKKVTHLFAGRVYCQCGQKMYVPYNMRKYSCKKCLIKIAITDLDTIFHEQLRGFVFSPEEIAKQIEKGQAQLADKQKLLETLEQEHKKLKVGIDSLLDLYQSGAIDKHGFGEKYHPQSARLQQIEAEMPAAQATVDVLRIALLSQDEIFTEARDLYSRWESLSPDEKRAIVETIVDRIVVSKEDVEIHLAYIPTPTPRNSSGNGGSLPSSGSPGNRNKMATNSQGLKAPTSRNVAG